ncbi:hypothetical protein Ddye_028047 [Dipteronia dyeriana]|uniref:hAT-like transposase RNase-H fold domain-containing protein n=1 Tax=Dipteronia dyeriana TaxID=168575 RepID=A0AAD9TQA2_9ROSI|nr:hypothetical protein Ddye_028047 [Dipteronia dyeriana]
MNGWLNSPNIEIQAMTRGMIAKFDKYWRDVHGVMVVVVVLDARYKMLFVDFHFSKIYGSSASSQREIVHELLKDLIKEYELRSSFVEQLDDSSLDHSFDMFRGDEDLSCIKVKRLAVSTSQSWRGIWMNKLKITLLTLKFCHGGKITKGNIRFWLRLRETFWSFLYLR